MNPFRWLDPYRCSICRALWHTASDHCEHHPHVLAIYSLGMPDCFECWFETEAAWEKIKKQAAEREEERRAQRIANLVIEGIKGRA